MAAVPRDANFWRRFSLAVHQDEESKRPELKQSESWLEEQRRKKSKRTCMCWCFWIVLLGVVAGIIVAVVILRDKGII